MIDAVDHVKERTDCCLYKNGMCNKWRKEYKCRPTSIEKFDEVFSTCEIGETCERASIFGNYLYRLTDEDIDGWKEIIGFSDDWAVDKARPRVEIEIIEMED